MELFKLFGTIVLKGKEAFEKKLDDISSKADKLGKTLTDKGEKISKFGTKVSNAGTKLLPVTAAITGIGGASIKTAADFEASMSQVAATMGMTAEEINNGSEDYERLSQCARDMGKATKFSASEAAEALNYLALAGYDVDKSIDTLPTVLNLAAAGGIDLASASDMVTDAMSALGDTAGTCESFVDKMATTSQKSNTSVAQLGEAILTVGGTAKSMAGGVTEMNTCLGILADNGIKGAEGGTALRNIILSLSAPTDVAAKTMKQLGIEVYDAEGKMRPMNDVFKDLDSTLSTMTQGEQTEVLNTIFNKVDLKSAQALLANCGDRFDELSGYIDNSNGSAQKMAGTMMNNLNGQLTILKSALSEAGIAIGQKFVPYIKQATAKINEWVDWFNSLNESQQDFIIKIALVVGAIAPLLIALGKIITAVGSVYKVFGKIIPLLSKVKTLFLGLSAPVWAIIAVIAVLVGAFATLWKTNEDFRNKIIGIWNNIKDTVGGFIEGIKSRMDGIKQACQNIIDFIKPLWQGFCDYIAPVFTTAFQSIADAFKFVTDTILAIVDIFISVFTGDWSGLCDALLDLVLAGLQAIVDCFTNIYNFINEITGGLLTGIVNFFSDGFNAVVELFIILGESISEGLDTIGQFFVNCYNTITETFSNIGSWFSNKFTSAWNGIKKAFSSVGSFFSGCWNGIKNAFSNVVSFFGNTFSKAWQTIKDKFASWGEFWSGLWTKVKDKFASVGTAIGTAISDAVKSGVNGIISVIEKTINSGISLINGAINLINKIPGVSIGKMSKLSLPRLAKGAVLDKSTIAEVGEDGKEAIIPLERNTKGLDLIASKISERMNIGGDVEIQERMNKIIELLEKLLGMRITLDSGALVGGLAPAMDTALGNIYEAKGRGGRSTW